MDIASSNTAAVPQTSALVTKNVHRGVYSSTYSFCSEMSFQPVSSFTGELVNAMECMCILQGYSESQNIHRQDGTAGPVLTAVLLSRPAVTSRIPSIKSWSGSLYRIWHWSTSYFCFTWIALILLGLHREARRLEVIERSPDHAREGLDYL